MKNFFKLVIAPAVVGVFVFACVFVFQAIALFSVSFDLAPARGFAAFAWLNAQAVCVITFFADGLS